jgi:hypothetical protein
MQEAITLWYYKRVHLKPIGLVLVLASVAATFAGSLLFRLFASS